MPITQIRHDLKIMCNKEIGHVHFMLKRTKQFQNMSLNGNNKKRPPD
jgi:hypothetical protein